MTPARAYGLALFIFAADDLARWAMAGVPLFFAADYAAKISILGVLLAAGVHRLGDPPASSSAASLSPASPPRGAALIAWIVLAVLAGRVALGLTGWAKATWPTPYPYDWPKIESLGWLVSELTLGQALGVVIEELMARRLAWHVLAPRFAHPLAPLAISSVLFGIGHWGSGPWHVLGATVCGAILFAVYRRTGSLAAAAVVHYLINLAVFGPRNAATLAALIPP